LVKPDGFEILTARNMNSHVNEKDTRELQNDGEIWCIFKKGNKQAFAILYRRYFKVLFQYGIKMAEDKDLVKDCIHDLFIDLWKNKENLTAPKSVKAYLLSAIQHKLIRQLTRVRTRQSEMTRMKFPVAVPCREDQLIADQIHLAMGKNLARKFVEQSAHIVFFSFVA
jgi:DNA-directed RNA polymerase specialized sigma24 family protein